MSYRSRPSAGPIYLNKDSPQAQGLLAWWPLGFQLISDIGMFPNQEMVSNGDTWDSGPTSGDITNCRKFVSGSSQYMEENGGLGIVEPFSMTAWFYTLSAATAQIILSPGTGVSSRWQLSTNSGGFATAQSTDTANSGSTAISSLGYTTNKWQHIAGNFITTTSRAVFLDGGNKGTDAVARTVAAPALVNIGCRYAVASRGAFFNGYLADHRIYNKILGDDEPAMMYDPRSRWDLYWQPTRKVWSFATPAAAAGRIKRYRDLDGLGGVGQPAMNPNLGI